MNAFVHVCLNILWRWEPGAPNYAQT